MVKLRKEVLFAGISDEWLDLLDNDELDNVIKELTKFNNITPPEDKIFEFARLTNLSNVKVVIIAQDPYPRAGDAHGLALSCLTNVPASLLNIYKCLLKHKLITEIPDSGDLTYWAEQGVLLFNCALTTVTGKSNEHAKIWALYTNELISQLSDTVVKQERPLIFMLWGRFAQAKKEFINEQAIILEWTHPSPLAQHKQSFIECDNFVQANKILTKAGLQPIDWNVAPALSEVEEQFAMTRRKQIIFTDGSCNPNKICPEAVAGYAAVFVLGSMTDIILYGNIQNRPHYATNQRAEGIAIFKTLEYLKNHVDEWDSCIIVSDSDFWIKMYTVYIPSWERKDMDFNEKKNSDIVIPAYELYKELTIEYNKEIEFRHVQSHNKQKWGDEPKESYKYFCFIQNQYVDELCKFARLNLKPGDDVVGQVDYKD